MTVPLRCFALAKVLQITLTLFKLCRNTKSFMFLEKLLTHSQLYLFSIFPTVALLRLTKTEVDQKMSEFFLTFEHMQISFASEM